MRDAGSAAVGSVLLLLVAPPSEAWAAKPSVGSGGREASHTHARRVPDVVT